MTTTVDDMVEVSEDTGPIPVVAADEGAAEPTQDAAPPASTAPRRSAGLQAASVSLMILAALTLGFVAHVTLVSSLEHNRAQELAYDQFREEAASGTAPVGQRDAEGNVLVLGTPVATMTIPALGVDEVVLEGTTSGVLMDGPGHRRDTRMPGQAGAVVVMGRALAYGGPFADLETLVPGSEVRFVTGQGESTYEVTGLRRAGDPGPQPLEEGQGRLTLVTADGPWYAPTGAIYVDAELTSEPQPAPARAFNALALPEAEKPMQGDPSSWVVLVFLLQAFILAVVAVVVAAQRWGKPHAWLFGFPLIALMFVLVADQAMKLMPNLW